MIGVWCAIVLSVTLSQGASNSAPAHERAPTTGYLISQVPPLPSVGDGRRGHFTALNLREIEPVTRRGELKAGGAGLPMAGASGSAFSPHSPLDFDGPALCGHSLQAFLCVWVI